ncbi:MAG: hypothetical protein AUJ12_03755 [Alphaproteobacteria bacterium CG1_02_46_17]|nr:MAG: hypothetical protein AUJ12_03755 [Alphaproteobacteria bacterium CG1_02_46_17]
MNNPQAGQSMKQNFFDAAGTALGVTALVADLVVGAVSFGCRKVTGQQDVKESSKQPLFITRLMGFDHE